MHRGVALLAPLSLGKLRSGFALMMTELSDLLQALYRLSDEMHDLFTDLEIRIAELEDEAPVPLTRPSVLYPTSTAFGLDKWIE